MSILMPRQGMILAAGLGKRMRPLTDHIPKPMIDVAGRTLIDRALDHLEQGGVTRIIINSSYKAQMLEEYLKRRPNPPLFSREEEPLETGGGIVHALHYFGGAPFFTINGDIIWVDGPTSALTRLAHAWTDELDALLLVHPVGAAIGYEGKGDFFMDKKGFLTRRNDNASAPYVYAGVQLLHPRLFIDCPPGAFSLNLLYDRAMAMNLPRIKALIHDGAWLHVGDVKGRALAEEYLLRAQS